MNRSSAAVALLATCFTAGLSAEVDTAAVEEARDAFVSRMVATHDWERAELEALLHGAKLDSRVLEAISRPAERVLPWHEYRAIFLTEARIEQGVAFWRTHEADIRDIAERYEVPAELIVAIIGIESYFGQRTGSFRVLDALATLAFAYPPRSTFFASELEHFLLLSREEAIDPREVTGSYAGAMGAGQFISSSYRAYAVDGDGDGRRDLWGSWPDVLASVANYFKAHGWRMGEPVAERATLSPSWQGPTPSNSLQLTETIASLSRMGYVFPTELPESSPATVLALEGEAEQEYWVGYHNFGVITRYNRSVMYALAAHQLGQAILGKFQSQATAVAREERGG